MQGTGNPSSLKMKASLFNITYSDLLTDSLGINYKYYQNVYLGRLGSAFLSLSLGFRLD